MLALFLRKSKADDQSSWSVNLWRLLATFRFFVGASVVYLFFY